MTLRSGSIKEVDGRWYIIGKDRLRPAVKCACLVCGLPFLARDRGTKTARFCSKRCSNHKMRIAHVCAFCGAAFERAAHAFYGRNAYCNKTCVQQARTARIGFYGGNVGRQGVRQICSTERPRKCEECGDPRAFLLDVHHRDGDHLNNPRDGSNWEVLCPSCHRTRHLRVLEEGGWIYDTGYLTPRHLLPQLRRELHEQSMVVPER